MALDIKEVKIDLLDFLQSIRDPEAYDKTRATARFFEELSYGIHESRTTHQISTVAICQLFSKTLKNLPPASRDHVITRVMPKMVVELAKLKKPEVLKFAVELNKFIKQFESWAPRRKKAAS
jgi:hypothetical protein